MFKPKTISKTTIFFIDAAGGVLDNRSIQNLLKQYLKKERKTKMNGGRNKSTVHYLAGRTLNDSGLLLSQIEKCKGGNWEVILTDGIYNKPVQVDMKTKSRFVSSLAEAKHNNSIEYTGNILKELLDGR